MKARGFHLITPINHLEDHHSIRENRESKLKKGPQIEMD
jgi:hypothetical protein